MVRTINKYLSVNLDVKTKKLKTLRLYETDINNNIRNHNLQKYPITYRMQYPVIDHYEYKNKNTLPSHYYI